MLSGPRIVSVCLICLLVGLFERMDLTPVDIDLSCILYKCKEVCKFVQKRLYFMDHNDKTILSVYRLLCLLCLLFTAFMVRVSQLLCLQFFGS